MESMGLLWLRLAMAYWPLWMDVSVTASNTTAMPNIGLWILASHDIKFREGKYSWANRVLSICMTFVSTLAKVQQTLHTGFTSIMQALLLRRVSPPLQYFP